MGSSPRMRGTLAYRRGVIEDIGIIPAHAGNTLLSHSVSFALRDHPRACGEHFINTTGEVDKTGSSPRMRGTLPINCSGESVIRIIPAHAGNTDEAGVDEPVGGDHPRACGEHAVYAPRDPIREGSSPRMRGTRLSQGRRGPGLGIIPAHAGNTPLTPTRSTRHRDHPRACGEHFCHWLSVEATPGSSPRMRGTPGPMMAIPRLAGIIPAHAGNTNRTRTQDCHTWDHPRACGEH